MRPSGFFCLAPWEFVAVEHEPGGGVARRGGLQRVSEAKPMEVRSDRTPQPERAEFTRELAVGPVFHYNRRTWQSTSFAAYS